MRRRHAIGLLGCTLAWLAGCDGATREPQAQWQWPALPVRDLAGRLATMPAPSGKARIINVWALWCAPCRQELPSLQRLAATWATGEVWAVALAEDSFAVREYLAQHAPGLHSVVLAPLAPQVRELGLATLPQTFAVSRDGAVLARWTGAREWDSPAQRQQVARLLQAA